MKVTDIHPGSPCWTQLSTSDVEAAKKFYGELFGWTAETDPRPEVGGYTTFQLDGAPPPPPPRRPARRCGWSRWTCSTSAAGRC